MASYNDYTVAWVTTDAISSLAAQCLFDEKDSIAGSNVSDDFNAYYFGRMGKHKVVVCYLPQGDDSTSVTVKKGVEDMLRIFRRIRVAVLVGIGGGAPSDQRDIRLGDVVASGRGGELPCLARYHYHRTGEMAFNLHHYNIPASPAIADAAKELRIRYLDTTDRLARRALYVIYELRSQRAKNPCTRPDQNTDKLYKPHCKHGRNDVASCSQTCGGSPANLVERSPRVGKENPIVHHGLIASSSRPMKDALIRDKLALEKKVLCFENEAAALMNMFPSFVIKGIGDYADTHTHSKDLDCWKGYAAAAASAYAKDFLYVLSPERVKAEEPLPIKQPTLAPPTVSAPASLRVWLEKKPHSVEGHTRECTLTFNGSVIWGPRSCHDNTIRLADALSAADPRFQLILRPKRKTIEGHTRSISVMAGGRRYLDRLSTHDNMIELCKVINECLASEPVPRLGTTTSIHI